MLVTTTRCAIAVAVVIIIVVVVISAVFSVRSAVFHNVVILSNGFLTLKIFGA